MPGNEPGAAGFKQRDNSLGRPQRRPALARFLPSGSSRRSAGAVIRGKPMTLLHRSAAAQQTLVRATLADAIILVARIMIGLIFVMSGWSKLMNFGGAVAGIAKRGVPEALAYLAPPVEFFGGLAI